MLKNREFGKLIMDVLKDRIGNDYEVAEREVTKNNGVILSGLSITKKDATISPTIYLESMEEEYEKGMVNISQIIERIIDTVKKEPERDSLPNGLAGIVNDPEKVYENCYPRVVNAEKNTELLKEVPHDLYLDLAVVYVIRIWDIFDTPGNIMIRNDLADKIGLSRDRLRESAFKNLRRDGYVTSTLTDMLKGMLGDMDEIHNEDFCDTASFQMYVVTNDSRYFGANCLLDNEVFVELSDRLGSDLYVLPSSVHEVICVEASNGVNPMDLAELVHSVNSSSVSDEDYLSDTIYHFQKENRRLTIA